MKIIGYIRVSKKELNEENQRLAIKNLLEKEEREKIEWFVDTISGSSNESGETKMEELKHLIGKKQVKAVYFYAIDRLTRNGALNALNIIKLLDENKVDYKSVTEPYLNSKNPFNSVLVSFAAEIARLERNRLIERTKAGLERAKKEGKELGRPSKIKNLKELKQLKENGFSNKKCSQFLNCSISTIKRGLKSIRELEPNFLK